MITASKPFFVCLTRLLAVTSFSNSHHLLVSCINICPHRTVPIFHRDGTYADKIIISRRATGDIRARAFSIVNGDATDLVIIESGCANPLRKNFSMRECKRASLVSSACPSAQFSSLKRASRVSTTRTVVSPFILHLCNATLMHPTFPEQTAHVLTE